VTIQVTLCAMHSLLYFVMRTDSWGNPTTVGNAEALLHLEHAVDCYVHFRGDIEGCLNASLESDANFALSEAFKGYIGVLGTEPVAAQRARKRLDAYLENTDQTGLLERERLHLSAADAFLNGDFHTTSRILETISTAYPRDILSLIVGHQIDFFTGDAVRLERRVGNALHAWTPDDPHHSNLLGMHAFGLEETNQHARALEVGLDAVNRNPKDVWGIHAVTHTFEEMGRFGDGTRFFDERLNDWTTGNYFNLHNWWHYALFALELGDDDKALAINDAVLFTENKGEAALELLDASALCWRLLLEGRVERERFARQAEIWKRKIDPAFYAFNDMHAVMSFVGANDETSAETLIDNREHWLETHPDPSISNVAMTRNIGLPVCKALLEFGRGHYANVVTLLHPIRHRLHEFGGSHAQRDVVLKTLNEAALRDGQYTLAQTLLEERIHVRPRSPYHWLKHATALEGLGQTARAAISRGTGLEHRLEGQRIAQGIPSPLVGEG
jgi:tetratricopeptide (TPR) repeat protein